MDNEYYDSFVSLAEKAIAEKENGVQAPVSKPPSIPLLPFRDISNVCSHVANSYRKTIESLDEELIRFESHFAGGQNGVFWATDYNEVFKILSKLFKAHRVKSVRLPNIKSSTIFRELGIKYFLRDENIDLRDDGDMQFFAADMMLSDVGALLLFNQSNTTLSKLSNNRPNVFFVTIDKLLSNSNMSEVVQTISFPGVSSSEMILFKGSPNCNNYLLVIDNQRTNILAKKSIRNILSCVDCGRCKMICPVYQTIGDEPYNNVFTGPVANVVLPYLESLESYMHVSFACTLCGRCEEVCPISLPLRDMIVDIRQSLFASAAVSKRERRMLAVLYKTLNSRKKMNASSFFKRSILSNFITSELKKNRDIIPLSKESFNSWYKNNHHDGE